jgi:hypothetical protein
MPNIASMNALQSFALTLRASLFINGCAAILSHAEKNDCEGM